MTMSRKRIRTRPAASAERNRAKKITTPTFIANQEELWASHRAGSAAQDSHGRAYGLETTNSAAAHWETGTTGDASSRSACGWRSRQVSHTPRTYMGTYAVSIQIMPRRPSDSVTPV